MSSPLSTFAFILCIFGASFVGKYVLSGTVGGERASFTARPILAVPAVGHRASRASRARERRPLPADGQPIGTTFFRHNALARRIRSKSPPLDPESVAMVEAVSGGGLGRLQFDHDGQGGTAVSTGHRGDRLYLPRCLAGYGLPPDRNGCPVLPTHIRTGATDGTPTDYHSAFLDAASNRETDAWLTCATDSEGNLEGHPCRFPLNGPLRIGWGASGSLSGDGTGFGGTASNLALTAGIVRAEDLLAGVDTHGILVAVQCGDAQAHVYPARGTDAKGSATCLGATAQPRYGQILWLDGPGEAEMLAINPVVLHPYIRMWHDYGAYVADKNEARPMPRGWDAITPELEISRAWLHVIAAIRSDPHPIDIPLAGDVYHLNPKVPKDFASHLHVLAMTCSTRGC